LEVVPLCPFEAGALLWEPEPGHSSLTVLVKGTFALAPGELAVAPAQDPLAEERHLEDSALASLHWPGDFAPVKRKVDVTLVGHAYAPGGRPVEELSAQLTVGDLVKAVRVTGDRLWTAALTPSAPQPFTRLPLRYERAALSADNPVGLDRNAPPHPGQLAAPNLTRVVGVGTPCFGPISPQWRARRRVLDDTAMFWAYGIARAPRESAPPLGPAPPRFDFAFFNAAPADQQIELLRVGAPIVLENLHPEHARLETRVPAMRPQVFRLPPPGAGRARVEEIILRCDSLWIDTDRRVVVLTWRGLAEAPGGIAGVGTLVVDADPEGKKLRWERVEKRYAEVRPPTLRLPGEGLAALGQAAIAEGPDPLAVRYDGRSRPPDGPADTRAKGAGDTVPPPPVLPVGAVSDELTNPLDEPTLDRLVPPPARLAPPKPPTRPEAPPPSRQATITQVSPAKPAPPRPPLPAPPVPAKKPAPGGAQSPPALRKDLGIEAYGALCAELGRPGADRAQVLRSRLLTEPVWAHVDQHWKRALAQETEAGGGALQAAFDDAYLDAQTRLGRPVGVAEYARIQVAVERGEIGRVLADLGLELGDLMRLQRAFARRRIADPALAPELARAVEEARRSGSLI
jgi:hypothetical protein